MRSIILKEGQIPGFTVIQNKVTGLEEVIIHYNGSCYFNTCIPPGSFDELKQVPSPEPTREIAAGDLSIKEPAHSLSESGVLSIVAMLKGIKEVPN